MKFTYQGGDYWYFDEKQTIRKIDKALMQQIIREGKENGLLATAHAFYYDDVKELLEAGIYGIEHGILDRDIEPTIRSSPSGSSREPGSFPPSTP